jgi:molecular chaperone DnaJ
MHGGRDFYVILGVARDATLETIKRAYRRLAKRIHPDADNGSTAAFQELQRAYETLADVERRRHYDEALRRAERPPSWSFLRSPARMELRRPLPRETMCAEILLSPEEAATGGVLPLDVPVTSECPSCEGTGGFAFDCERCFGEGHIERRLPVPVRIPAGIRGGTVFQVGVEHEPKALAILLTIHVAPR